MRIFPASLLCFALLLAAPAAYAGVTITIDKSAQRMSVAVDGVQRYSWAVSTGRAGRETPDGSFTAFRMEADHYSKEWDDAPMPHSIFFTKQGHAIHGSYDTKKLGSPASAGCVRLAPANAATLFALVKEQGLLTTKVMISGEEPSPAVVARHSREAPGRPMRLDPDGYGVPDNGVYQDQYPYGFYGARPAPAPRVRVAPDPYGQREPLDNYTTRMRQRYYQQQPPAPRVDDRYYVERPTYYGQRPYYGQPYYEQPPQPRRAYPYYRD